MKEKTTFCISFPYDLYNKVKEKAKSKNISMGSLIKIAISEYFERNS